MRYLHGAGVDERLMYWQYDDISGTETASEYYLTNHQGSVVATASSTTGQRVKAYTYDAYGNIGTEQGASQPFRYTGRRYDAETGLYYYRARYYSATLGRFMQTDPIGYEDNMNLYGYTGNDPVNFVDPFGLAQNCFTSFTQETTKDTEEEGEVTAKKVVTCIGDNLTEYLDKILENTKEIAATVSQAADVAKQCVVYEGEISIGFQYGAKLGFSKVEASFLLDGGSARARFGNNGFDARVTQGSEFSLARGLTSLGAKRQREEQIRSLPDRAGKRLRTKSFEDNYEAFHGFEGQVAGLLGLSGKLGVNNKCLD